MHGLEHLEGPPPHTVAREGDQNQLCVFNNCKHLLEQREGCVFSVRSVESEPHIFRMTRCTNIYSICSHLNELKAEDLSFINDITICKQAHAFAIADRKNCNPLQLPEEPIRKVPSSQFYSVRRMLAAVDPHQYFLFDCTNVACYSAKKHI